MAFQGIKDPAKVEDIINRLGTAKTKLNNAKTEADNAANGLAQHWVGPDASRFQTQWAKDSNTIDSCVKDVTAMQKKLEAELAEQKAASN